MWHNGRISSLLLKCQSAVERADLQQAAGRHTDASRADKQRLCLICLQLLEAICAGQASLNLTWALNISQARKKIGEAGGGGGGGVEFKATYIVNFTEATRQTGRNCLRPLPRSAKALCELNSSDGSVLIRFSHDRLLRPKVDEKKTYNCEFEDFLYLIL